MRARSFVQIVVVVLVLVVLFGVRLDTAQANAIVPANGLIGLSSSRPPLQVRQAEPPLVPDSVLQLTVVVIALSAGAGVLGSRLTRKAYR